jgi:hypothetical protein
VLQGRHLAFGIGTEAGDVLDAQLARLVRDDLGGHVQRVGKEGAQVPDRAQLEREAQPGVRPTSLPDQVAVAVVQEEGALELGAGRRSVEPPVGGDLLVGEEFDRHAPQNGRAVRSVTRRRALSLVFVPIFLMTRRPLVYRPTPRLLQMLGAETLEEGQRTLDLPAQNLG